MRHEVYYQVTAFDLRNMRIAQAATAIFASISTFSFSVYVDFRKDISLADQADQPVDALFHNVVTLLFGAFVLFALLALTAWILQGTELRKIKAAHGQRSWLQKFWSKYVSRKTSEP